MDQVHVVRHKVLVEGHSVRKVAREMGVSRNTVKRYLEMAAPVRVEHAPRGRPVWEKVRSRVEGLLEESPKWTGGKQRQWASSAVDFGAPAPTSTLAARAAERLAA